MDIEKHMSNEDNYSTPNVWIFRVTTTEGRDLYAKVEDVESVSRRGRRVVDFREV